MKRFLKISRLLKIAQGQDIEAWKAVLAEAENDQLPPEYTGIVASAEESVNKAKEIKAQAESAKDKIGNTESIPPDIKKGLTDLVANPEALRAFVEAAHSGVSTASIMNDSSIAISKRAGIFGSIWSAVKGGVKTLFHYFPFIGVIWALYAAKDDFEEVQKSSITIRDSFSDLGDNEKLFDGKYISSLIDGSKDDAEKMLKITKLNEIAKFYNENVYMVWADVAWFVSDLIGAILLIGAAVSTAGVGAAAGVILGRIAMALGLGSAAAAISVDFFDAMLGTFEENKEKIINIAKNHIGTESVSTNNVGGSQSSELDMMGDLE